MLNYYSELSLIKNTGDWLYVVPLLVVLTGIGEILSNWCTRKNHYKLIGVSEIFVSLILNGTRIMSGTVYGSSILGLIVGNISGLVSKIIILFYGTSNERNESDLESDFNLFEIGKKFKEFPLYSVPTGLLNKLFLKLPVIMLGVMFLPSVVGLYAMANRITRLPIDMISLPVRRIYMQRIAKLRNGRKRISGVLIKITIGLFLLGLIPFLLIAAFGEDLFSLVLGEKWEQAGVYASILVPWLFSVFILTPSSANFVVLKKQALWLRIQIYNGCIGGVVFSAGYILRMPVDDILRLFSIVGMWANIGIFIIAFVITIRADKNNILN